MGTVTDSDVTTFQVVKGTEVVWTSKPVNSDRIVSSLSECPSPPGSDKPCLATATLNFEEAADAASGDGRVRAELNVLEVRSAKGRREERGDDALRLSRLGRS